MKALIAASSAEELKYFSRTCYIKIATGVGLTLAASETAKAINEYAPDIVISVGSAGAINKTFKIGDIVSFSSVINLDQDLSRYHLKKGTTIKKDGSSLSEIPLLGGDGFVLASSSSFSADPAIKADAADMECYSVAYSSSIYNIPSASFKLITDIVGQDLKLADYKRILREGREKLENVVFEFLQTI